MEQAGTQGTALNDGYPHMPDHPSDGADRQGCEREAREQDCGHADGTADGLEAESFEPKYDNPSDDRYREGTADEIDHFNLRAHLRVDRASSSARRSAGFRSDLGLRFYSDGIQQYRRAGSDAKQFEIVDQWRD